MKTLKKILVVFTFVLMVGALTACSSINKVSRNFEQAGYSMYEYNFRGGSILFSAVDAIVNDLDITVELTTVTTGEGSEPTTTASDTQITVITASPLASVLGFRAYAFSNGRDKVAIVLEFKNADYMREVINESPALQAILEGLDEADYINNNCILIADAAYFDEVSGIFTGTNIPAITTELTTEVMTTEETTTTE